MINADMRSVSGTDQIGAIGRARRVHQCRGDRLKCRTSCREMLKVHVTVTPYFPRLQHRHAELG